MALTKTTWSMIDDSVFNVTDYGAVGDGIVNDRDAIIAAIAAAKVNGGGTIVFPLGTYIVDGTEQVVAIPELNGSLVYATADYDVQIYIQNANNLNFVFEGAVLKSTKTDSGFTLLLDGCSNITFTNLRMIGATVMSGTTATTIGTNAIGLISLTVDSRNISFFNTRIQDHYGSVDIAGNPASIYSVSNVTFSGSTYLSLGYYGISCRGNGNNVSVENLYSYRQNRGFFIYDTQQISITGTIDFLPLSGFQCLVKCYTTNTRNIKLNCVYKNKSNLVTSRLEFQSQHNPTLQPTPAYLSDIYVEYNEVNCGSSGIGILF